jgi:hypothetical protein
MIGAVDDRYSWLAIGSQFVLLIYFEAVSWVPLGRWNYQPCCPTASDLFSHGKLEPLETLGLLAFVLPVVAFWCGVQRKNKWLMLAALIFYSIWLILQVTTWWPPYVFGASESWKEVYDRAFSASTQVLPAWEDHLPPDGMHLVLQILLVVAVWSGYAALVRAWKPRHA